MRLFHVSENPEIQAFEPRLPKRRDLYPMVGLVNSGTLYAEHIT